MRGKMTTFQYVTCEQCETTEQVQTETRTWAARQFKAKGWIYRRNRWYCSECAKGK